MNEDGSRSRGRMGRIAVAAVLLCGAALPVAGRAGERAPGAVPDFAESGIQRLEIELEGGGAMRLAVAVPRDLAPKDRPLVLALHYGGEVTPYYGESFLRILVLPAFKNSGALLVAPDCPGRGWSEGPSERAVLALLDHAVSRWSVDPDRIAVTGFSMGGIGTWFLAEKHPGRFAAAIPVAGRPTGVAEMRVPVYAIHGKRDEVIDWRPTARAVEQLRSRGRTAEIDLVDGPTHYQTARFTRPLARAARWLAEMWTDRSGTLEAAPR